MKNVLVKPTKTESPKTPGGISKSLLTPCRRVGLSRNWKRSGSSPFISPVSSGEPSQAKTDVRKRKQPEELEGTSQECGKVSQSGDIDVDKTPSRVLGVPRRKRSKTLLSALKPEEEMNTSPIVENCLETEKEGSNSFSVDNTVTTEPLSTPVRLKSKSKSKKSLSSSITSKNDVNLSTNVENSDENFKVSNDKVITKQNSPKDLVKECIVVIRKKILKQKSNELDICKDNTDIKCNDNTQSVVKTSQEFVDSDSDDIPLCKLNKNEVKISSIVDEDDDFIDSNVRPKQKIENKILVNEQPVKKPKEKNKNSKSLKTKQMNQQLPSSQCEDDDFDFDNKKTILIRKCYEKVAKPSKAKSTGSITQKDIDDIKARIESKKNLLLANAMTEDTEELRNLIKKWRIGCQNALMELMELMKNKLPDKQNMEYSEILKSLKIPSSLVGYDSDNDCFITPEDTSIILSGLNM